MAQWVIRLITHSGRIELFLIPASVTRKEGTTLFNDALNTFYLRLYDIRHMVKDHSDSERGNPLPPHRLSVTKVVVCAILSVRWCILKEPLLLIKKRSPCSGGRGFLLLSEWSFTICLMPYTRIIKSTKKTAVNLVTKVLIIHKENCCKLSY